MCEARAGAPSGVLLSPLGFEARPVEAGCVTSSAVPLLVLCAGGVLGEWLGLLVRPAWAAHVRIQGGQAPDVILYPAGGGVGLIGIHKALLEMRELGWLVGDLPRLVAVQSTGCQPIVEAFHAGAATPVRVSCVWGRVLSRFGDVFGPSVNVAARLTDQAEPGTVLLDPSTAAEVRSLGGYHLVDLTERDIDGIGPMRPVRLERVRLRIVHDGPWP